MEGLFIVLVLLAGIGYLLIYLRKREVEKFMDADMVDFHHFKDTQQADAEEPDPLMARAEAYAAMNPGVVALRKPQKAEPDPLLLVDPPDPVLFELREDSFDEVRRNMMILLNRVAPEGVTVLLDVPLAEFVQTSQASVTNLDATRITYLLCEQRDMSIVCGAQHRDAGVTGRQSIDKVKRIFGDLGIPLIEFPVSNDISEFEVRDKLEHVLVGSDEQQACPVCGQTMSIRKAVKGKRAGRIFWVCTDFPSCRGVVKV